ncbi:MAG: flagellin [Alphaproteobacteria bacterium]|nr:flagellin [Alphaproteobacteria bacterium]
MTVSNLTALAAGIQRSLNQQNTRVATAISQIVSGNRLVSASTDVAALATATSLQTQTSGLRNASINISQASSLLQVADGGAGQISNALDRLQSLAVQAGNGSLSDADRGALNQEFQALAQEIDRISGSTKFNSTTLLDGSLSSGLNFQIGGDAGDQVSLSIGGLASNDLFGGSTPDISTAAGASAALTSLQTARDTVSATRADIGAFQQGLDFAAATIETAIQNQEAARSELADADIAELSTESAQARVQQQASISLLAQTNRLSGNLLTLLNE